MQIISLDEKGRRGRKIKIEDTFEEAIRKFSEPSQNQKGQRKEISSMRKFWHNRSVNLQPQNKRKLEIPFELTENLKVGKTSGDEEFHPRGDSASGGSDSSPSSALRTAVALMALAVFPELLSLKLTISACHFGVAFLARRADNVTGYRHCGLPVR